ncbi:tigger transposable element-derived protein 1-like [Portunus trituberculatus]|uniref:tigger transposable element-derived protein 1-like n=1 Tax=Portunus trituberculatus TaxID=210409 RepID=UPI001E1CFEF3|nr:tigger transposable element-derived protein 1-like [Portunus trituberculatus]
MVPSLSPKKKAHKAVDLKVKLNIIERMRKGARVSSLAKELRLTVSTVSTVWCKWDRYEGPAKTAVDAECLKVVWMRDEKMNKMECASGSRTGFSDISLSASSLYSSLVNEQQQQPSTSSASPSAPPASFKASHGWFYLFKERAGLHNLRIQGEAAIADTVTAQEFPATLQKVVQDNDHESHQVFNIDEMGLCWKRMPSRTLRFQEEKVAPGFKAVKDLLTLALGCNASGDVKLKRLLVYHSKNHIALKGVLKSNLPVVWRSNRKVYTRSQNLDNKCLLLLDDTPGCPPNMNNWCDHGLDMQGLPSVHPLSRVCDSCWPRVSVMQGPSEPVVAKCLFLPHDKFWSNVEQF